MYQGGVGAMHDANQREEQREREDHGVGAQEQVVAGSGGGEHDTSRPSLPSFYAQDNPSSANEIWQRLHGDPLMIMKQQELQARRSIVSNPIKMDAIKKMAKEEEKTKRHKHGGSSSSSSRHHRRRHRDEDDKDGDDARYRRRRHHGDEDDARHHRRRHHDDEDRHRRRRHRSTSRHKRYDDPSPRRREERHHHTSSQRDPYPVHHSKQPEDPRYGITFASNAPEAVRQKDRSSIIEDTQKRLEEAARKKEQEQREQAAQRHTKRAHTTGRLTEEEKRRRLEEMSLSAKEVERHRSERVSTYQNKAHAEEKALYDANRSSTRDFLRREALDRLHKS